MSQHAVADGKASGPLVLLELFTSQGCYSCPPAEKLLASTFIGHPDVLALEMHVDYWDELVYNGSSWRDPFSSAQYTNRQRQYSFSSGRGPFTPQMVIAGAFFTSGTNKDGIMTAVERVVELELAKPWEVNFISQGDSWEVELGPNIPEDSANAITVIYLKDAETVVVGGENKGKVLENHNVVLNLKGHGAVAAGQKIAIGKVEPEQGCAVIIQRPPQGVVLGVWKCPTETAGAS